MSFLGDVRTRIAGPRRLSLEETLAKRSSGMRPASSVVGGGSFSSGPWTYWHESARFYAYKPGDEISLGAFTSVSPDVRLLAGGNHNIRHLAQYPFTLMSRAMELPAPEPQPLERIAIGSDVWIGTGATIVGDVTVGDGAVVGAGAVVTKDVAPYTIVAGVPARVIGTRVGPEEIERLLRIRWWEWPDDVIREAEPILRSQDVSALERFAGLRASKGNG